MNKMQLQLQLVDYKPGLGLGRNQDFAKGEDLNQKSKKFFENV